ncbi:MAG: glycogen synthase [bacterium]
MIAAECRDLAKVGGLADVVRDLSTSLKTHRVPVRVLMPYYEVINYPAEYIDSFKVRFGDKDWPVRAFGCVLDGVPIYLLRSDDFFGGLYGDVYIDSDKLGRGPFEDDAKRFAFFSAAAVEFIQKHLWQFDIEVLHCHDWHTGILLFLLKHDRRYRPLANTLRTLFTIHNLDYQGTRPFELHKDSDLLSFAGWFPELYQDLKVQGRVEAFSDPRTALCFNPMRAGINLADNVNTVSPTYAREITQPDNPANNFIGGRGLENDLLRLRNENRLHGILNGIDYQKNNPINLDPPFDANSKRWKEAREKHKINLVKGLGEQIQRLNNKLGEKFKNSKSVMAKMSTYHPDDWLERPLVVAVTRAVHQKMGILVETLDGKDLLLREILKKNVSLVILGTGELEDQLERINRWPNGVFVCAFDPQFAARLYAAGDIFLMPSDFEPCGISQMIAMRYGCLPLVYDIGGLHDTVQDMRTGFVYSGTTRHEVKQAFLKKLDEAVNCYLNRKQYWMKMQKQAMAVRFEWKTSAKEYIKLYCG